MSFFIHFNLNEKLPKGRDWIDDIFGEIPTPQSPLPNFKSASSATRQIRQSSRIDAPIRQ